MFENITTSVRISAVVAATTAAILASSTGAQAQVIRCENFVFANERIACYYYRAAQAGPPVCLFCAPPQVQQPVKRVKKKRRVRH